MRLREPVNASIVKLEPSKSAPHSVDFKRNQVVLRAQQHTQMEKKKIEREREREEQKNKKTKSNEAD